MINQLHAYGKHIFVLILLICMAASAYLIHDLTQLHRGYAHMRVDTFMRDAKVQQFNRKGHLAKLMFTERMTHDPQTKKAILISRS